MIPNSFQGLFISGRMPNLADIFSLHGKGELIQFKIC